MRLFYQSPVSWGWLRQRPHFLAAGLAESGIDVFWFYAARLGKCRFRRIREGKRLVGLELPVLPFATRCRPIGWLNKIWVSWWLRNVSADAVVAANPAAFAWLPDSIASVPVLYDCMDMHAEFFMGRRHDRMLEEEGRLVAASQRIVASSRALQSYLVGTYGVEERRISVIGNGYEPAARSAAAECPVRVSHPSISYFGTVDFWFDWDAVTCAAESRPDWHFDIFGAVNSRPGRLPENVVLHGPIPHAHVAAQMSDSDILMMPFVHRRLVDGVDPVKMYEYLASGRPIVSSWWQELEKFRPFPQVSFYEGIADFEAVVGAELAKGVAYDAPAEFLEAHTWANLAREFGTQVGRIAVGEAK